MKIQSLIEDVLITAGITVSLIDIQQILSILLLVFNVIWILVKAGVRIYEHIKEKNIKAIENDVKDAKDEIEELKDKCDSGKQ